MRVTRNSTISLVTDLVTTERPAASQASAGAAHAPVPLCDVQVDGLSKRFGDNVIFENVSFRLARGESVALVGANGTGKSTLLRCVMGLIPASAGEVTLLQTPLSGIRPAALRALRARTGLVAQKHNLVPRLSVLSNVIHGLLGQGGLRLWRQSTAPAHVRAQALEALDKVGLAHLAERRADRLSGGQSQRVAIARALIGGPQVLIADEPCASLDPAAGEEVMALFFDLVRRDGVTVIFTSHDLDHALRYGDRVLGLADGGVQLDRMASSLRSADLRGLYG